ncbi:hypothetical protein ACJJTC_006232 [Scirpophaga incertulas]
MEVIIFLFTLIDRVLVRSKRLKSRATSRQSSGEAKCRIFNKWFARAGDAGRAGRSSRRERSPANVASSSFPTEPVCVLSKASTQHNDATSTSQQVVPDVCVSSTWAHAYSNSRSKPDKIYMPASESNVRTLQSGII